MTLTLETKMERLRRIDEEQGTHYRDLFLRGKITHEALHKITEKFMMESLRAELALKMAAEAVTTVDVSHHGEYNYE